MVLLLNTIFKSLIRNLLSCLDHVRQECPIFIQRHAPVCTSSLLSANMDNTTVHHHTHSLMKACPKLSCKNHGRCACHCVL